MNPTPRRVRDLPAPPGLPVVGNALSLDRERLHLTLEQWRRRYGDCFRFRNVRREVVVIADPEAIAAMLRDRPDGFLRTARLGAIAREMGFDGVFTANGEDWRRQRPMVMAGLDPAHIKSYFPALVRVTQRFAGRWAARPRRTPRSTCRPISCATPSTSRRDSPSAPTSTPSSRTKKSSSGISTRCCPRFSAG